MTKSKLQEKRQQKNYTQKELSSCTGIPLQTIRKLEIKHNKIESLSQKAFLALCRELERKPWEIIEDDELKHEYIYLIHKII